MGLLIPPSVARAAVLGAAGILTALAFPRTDWEILAWVVLAPLLVTAVSRPVTFGDVFATLYHTLGIDPRTATITDLSGRPQYLVDPGSEPISELL